MPEHLRKFRYGWSSWLILVIAFITVFFHRLSVGAVSDVLVQEIPMNSLVLGNLTAMNYYAYALMQIPVGILVDRVGVRQINLLGLLITAGGSLMFGLAHTIEVAYFARFLVGIGTSVIIVSIFKIQITWFPLSRFSTLSGFTSFFGNFGSLLAIYPLSYLTLILGWRQIFYLMAGISLFLVLLTFWGVRDRDTLTPLSLKKTRLSPSFAKAKTAGCTYAICQKFILSVSIKNSIFPQPETPSSFFPYLKQSLKSVLGNPKTWPNVLVLFSYTGSSTTLLGLWGIPLLMRIYDLNKSSAAGYLTYTTFGFILAAPLVSLIAKWVGGNRRTLLLATGSNFLLWIYITVISQGHPPLQLFPILFFLFGILIMFHLLAFSNVTAVNSLQYSGIATAITNMGEFIGSSLASLAIGFILDQGWAASLAWWVILIMAGLSFTGALLMSEETIPIPAVVSQAKA